MSFVSDLFKDGAKAFFGNEYLRDFQHASKTFVSDSYANAPKFKFLFHVYFDINPAIGNFMTWDKKTNFGLNVKNIQLPKFSFDLHTMNQYNRKRIVQTKMKFDPINISMHDDNAGMARKLWQAYSSYYYKDFAQAGDNNPTNKSAGTSSFDMTKRNQYADSLSGYDDWGYVAESVSGQVKPNFFNAINVFGFNQHNFVLYRLMNPFIESFSHDTYDYSSSDTMEHQLTLQYENVKYYEGKIDGKKPEAIIQLFGEDAHYDRVQSPNSRAGGQASIFGQGGLVDAGSSLIDDVASGNWLGAIQTAGRTATTFKNQNVGNLLKSEAITGVTNAAQGTPNRNLPFSFPTRNSTGGK